MTSVNQNVKQYSLKTRQNIYVGNAPLNKSKNNPSMPTFIPPSSIALNAPELWSTLSLIISTFFKRLQTIGQNKTDPNKKDNTT